MLANVKGGRQKMKEELLKLQIEWKEQGDKIQVVLGKATFCLSGSLVPWVLHLVPL
jgi:hypothetical protein